MKHSPKQDAIHDIKEEIKKENKLKGTHVSFIAYRTYLNPIMRLLVNQHVKQQKQLNYDKH